jgi:hypothetical protein
MDYPLGMVIRPPDAHDDGIFIIPDVSLWNLFGEQLQNGLGALGQLLVPGKT